MWFGIRITAYHKDVDQVLDFCKEWWSDSKWFFCLEIGEKKKEEHYHILVLENDVQRDAIRKRIKLRGWTGNKQYNLKELDDQRIDKEWIPYMCKTLTSKKKDLNKLYYISDNFRIKIKKMRRLYDNQAKEYKNKVMQQLTNHINKQTDNEMIWAFESKICMEVVAYYLSKGMCVPNKWRCMSLAQTLWLNRHENNHSTRDKIEDIVGDWYDRG